MARLPNPSTNRLKWIAEFSAELERLRPHAISGGTALLTAAAEYHGRSELSPVVAAQRYHASAPLKRPMQLRANSAAWG